jgi:hypothetical protein
VGEDDLVGATGLLQGVGQRGEADGVQGAAG